MATANEIRLERATELRAQARARRQAILDRCERENREDLTADETRSFRNLCDQIDQHDALVGELTAEVQRSGRSDPANVALFRAIAGDKTPPTQPGNHAAPLGFGQDDLRAMHEAAQRRSTYGIQARRPSADELQQRSFGSPDGLLPPQLFPGIVGMQHENRLLN